MSVIMWRNGRSAETVQIRVKDITPFGMGVACQTPMRIGEHFVVDRGEGQFLYSVVRCLHTDDGFRIGAQYTLRLGRSLSA